MGFGPVHPRNPHHRATACDLQGEEEGEREGGREEGKEGGGLEAYEAKGNDPAILLKSVLDLVLLILAGIF